MSTEFRKEFLDYLKQVFGADFSLEDTNHKALEQTFYAGALCTFYLIGKEDNPVDMLETFQSLSKEVKEDCERIGQRAMREAGLMPPFSNTTQ